MNLSPPPNSGASVRPPRLLLVDDDPAILRALRRMLLGLRPSWGIDVAESAEMALAALKARTYDVVVTDLQMPGIGGVKLLERLKLEHPTSMRVVHSSHVESLSSVQAEELAHAVINKPGHADELTFLLDWAIDQRRRRLRDSVGF